MPEKTSRKFIYFLSFMIVVNLSAFSQDRTFPFVHEEFFHQPVFENDQIRVLNVRASQGDTTAFHRHCYPILYITIQGVEVSLKEPSGSWKNVELPTGWIGQDVYEKDSCFVHRFAIAGKGTLHIVAVEALENSDQISLNIEPVYEEEGFSLFQIGSTYLPELAAVSVPVILVETLCKKECKVEVLNSREVSAKQLENHRAYVVAYQARL